MRKLSVIGKDPGPRSFSCWASPRDPLEVSHLLEEGNVSGRASKRSPSQQDKLLENVREADVGVLSLILVLLLVVGGGRSGRGGRRGDVSSHGRLRRERDRGGKPIRSHHREGRRQS